MTRLHTWAAGLGLGMSTFGAEGTTCRWVPSRGRRLGEGNRKGTGAPQHDRAGQEQEQNVACATEGNTIPHGKRAPQQYSAIKEGLRPVRETLSCLGPVSFSLYGPEYPRSPAAAVIGQVRP